MKKILSVILLFYASTLFPQVPDNEIIRCSFVGDMMIGTDYPYHVLPPDDGRTYFDNVRKYFSAMDIVFGNLEGALTAVKESRKNVAKKNYYAFRMPVRYADHFKNAGFNIISIANNHSLDFGIKGNNDTRNTLKEAGITVTGEKNKLAVIEKKGVKIGFIGYAWNENFNNIMDIGSARKLISSSRQSVDILIVSFHGGREGANAQNVKPGMDYFFGEKRGDVIAFSHAAVDSGADLVIGHGPHVLRGIERYRGKIIAYSLGNFATYGMFSLKNPGNISVILYVDFDRNGNIVSSSLLPVILKGRGIPEYDDYCRAITYMNRLSKADFKQPAIYDSNGKMVNSE